MKPMLTPKDQKAIHDLSVSLKQTYEDAQEQLEKFCINANKSAAKRARQSLMDMTKNAKVLRKTIQEAKTGIIKIDPVEYVAKIISDNNDLKSLQVVAKRLEVRVTKLGMNISTILAKKIAEYFINNRVSGLESDIEIVNIVKMAEKLDLRMGDLVGTVKR